MNKEIKEILDFKENADYKRLSCDEIKVLRDYITNLQQENEKLNYIIEKQDRDIVAISKGNKKLKSRIEKTAEYIESQNRFKEGCDIYLITNWEYVLNILKGEDND